MINEDLKKYIEEKILPEYEKNELAHSVEHILDVIRRSLKIVSDNLLEVNLNMVYVIAAYHDIGHYIDPNKHELISAEMMSKDENLKKFFSLEELEIIKEAIEDHRASLNREPRSIYGKIVSTADRNNTVCQCLKRSYVYGKKLDPSASDEELFERAYNVLKKKFGVNGYAKFYFKDSEYEEFLKEIRDLLENKEEFCNRQRDYIHSLKKMKQI